ncbi:two-component sensor histidine kinase [Stenotrophomonas sp. LMG 10879]|uniref:sensor histidine kinase n=1 Tax=Stenotrophomonas sp. LMG 10879 TaxID=487706 RepID=UPI000C190704|nr:histidine kinase [Stenotrophomonas sp. LMG 10879]PII19192.1 two-component sensor histidine kinase [Stenotrophomonas sp. LMG 10879]
MPTFFRHLLRPLSLAGLVTILVVGLTLGVHTQGAGLRWAVLGLFLLLFAAHSQLPTRQGVRLIAGIVQAGLAVAMVALEPRTGTAPILLVVLVAQLAEHWPPRVVLVIALAANIALYAVLRQAAFPQPLMIVLLYGGFQVFAALTAHYARSTALARDALARVNADLLATRALLADSARDAERLRLARELHDVAGHKLTAMRLNLRALAADPALAGRDGLLLAEQLSGELLTDIRQVVQSMRDDRGLDLDTALHALAAPFPRPRLQVQIAEGLRVTDPQLAETVLRLVQEALTNAARHADAGTVWLTMTEEDSRLRVDIRDDGQRAERISEGNGIAGMRERLAVMQGELQLARTEQGGMHLIARLPA